MSTTSNIPNPALPMVGQDGRLTPAWFQFLLTMYVRTGGALGQDANSLQAELEQGSPQPDLAGVYALIAAVEALAAQAQAAASQPHDERGEVGDGATLAHLTARIADMEARVEAMASPMLTDTAQLTNGAQFLAAPNNLSDVASVTVARANLGLDTAATHPATDFASAPKTSLPAAATDAASTQTLANAMRSALIASGVGA